MRKEMKELATDPLHYFSRYAVTQLERAEIERLHKTGLGTDFTGRKRRTAPHLSNKEILLLHAALLRGGRHPARHTATSGPSIGGIFRVAILDWNRTLTLATFT